eukprot:12917-Heterococcus_DN1.PRE.4
MKCMCGTVFVCADLSIPSPVISSQNAILTGPRTKRAHKESVSATSVLPYFYERTTAPLQHDVLTVLFNDHACVHSALYECMSVKNGAHMSALSKIVLHSVRRGHELISPHCKREKCVPMKYITHGRHNQDTRSSVQEEQRAVGHDSDC